MNTRDEKAVVSSLLAIINSCPDVTQPIAFDRSAVLNNLRNTPKTSDRGLSDINDLLSCTPVCKELGGIYTVCEYESPIWFLIRADRTHSVTSNFVPANKFIKQVPNAALGKTD